MEILAGAVLALMVCLTAAFSGLDRDRAFYPTILMVIATYYALFAVMNGSIAALLPESIAIVAFMAAAIAGFKLSLWLVVAGLAAHGLFDFVHGQLITNPGVPRWWPLFCLTFDAVAAGYLASRLSLAGTRSTAAR